MSNRDCLLFNVKLVQLIRRAKPRVDRASVEEAISVSQIKIARMAQTGEAATGSILVNLSDYDESISSSCRCMGK